MGNINAISKYIYYAEYNRNFCDSNNTSVSAWLISTGNYILIIYASSWKVYWDL